MPLTAGEIRRLHARLGPVEEILDCRRAIYRLALEAAFAESGSGAPDAELLSDAVVDNPAVRGHLGHLLAGAGELDQRFLRTLDDLVVVPAELPSDTPVRLASCPETAADLQGALGRLGTDLADDAFVTGTDALVIADSAGFDSVVRTVVDGIGLALDLAPELVGDLLPHVALLAVLRGEAAGRLGSASVREYPGLVLLPQPRTPLEVAEALVHEGAHQKFFDLAMTNHLVSDAPSERFSPPWSGEGAEWPFEQCVAAFHAYCCLTAFAGRVPDDIERHDYSLLPEAAERAATLGAWLADRGDRLGAEGQTFVGGLNQRGFAAPPAPTHVDGLLDGSAAAPENEFRRRCRNHTLVMRWGRPVALFWLPDGPREPAA